MSKRIQRESANIRKRVAGGQNTYKNIRVRKILELAILFDFKELLLGQRKKSRSQVGTFFEG